MPATVPPGAEAFSREVWLAPTRRSGSVRPGWLTAMVTEAREQLHRGLVPLEPRVPCQRRHPMAAPPAPPPG